MNGKYIGIGILIAAAVSAGMLLWRDSAKVSGSGYTELLLRMSESGSKAVPVGSPNNILTRVCFIPAGVDPRKPAEAAFKGLQIIFQERGNASNWHVAMHAPDRAGIWILKGGTPALQWRKQDAEGDASTAVCPQEIKVHKASDTEFHLRPVYP